MKRIILAVLMFASSCFAAGNQRKQSDTGYPLLFYMVQSADHISAGTGLTCTVTLSKNGGSFASASGSVSEIANGWYKVAGNATDSGTLGPLILHATATGADPADVVYEIVPYDPFARVDANLTYVGGSALSTSSAQIGVNVVSYASGQTPLQPTVAGRTLDVSAGGEAGVDWANIGSPTTSVNLSGTTVGTLTTYTGNTPQTGDAYARIGATGSGLTSLAPASTALSSATWTGTMATKLSDLLTSGYDTATHHLLYVETAGDLIKIQSENADAWMTNQDIDRVLNGIGSSPDIASGADLLAIKAKTDTITTAPTVGAIADAVWDEVQSGHTTSGTFGKYLDAQVSTISGGGGGASAGTIADAVWDELLSGHVISGSAGAGLSAAQSAGDPWATALPGGYTAGTAGSLLYSILSQTAGGVASIVNSFATTGDLQIVQGDDYPSGQLSLNVAWSGENIAGATATFSVQTTKNRSAGSTTGVAAMGTVTVGAFNSATGTYPVSLVLTGTETGALEATVANAAKNYHYEIAVTTSGRRHTVAEGSMSVRRRFN